MIHLSVFVRDQQPPKSWQQQGKTSHGQLLQFSLPAPIAAPRSNSPSIHPRTSIDPCLPPGLPTLRLLSPGSPAITALSPWHCLPPFSSSTFTSLSLTKPVSSCSWYTRLLCMGNRWRNCPIWHATRSKCGRCRSELRSA